MKSLVILSLAALLAPSLCSAGEAPDNPAVSRDENHHTRLERMRRCYADLLPGRAEFDTRENEADTDFYVMTPHSDSNQVFEALHCVDSTPEQGCLAVGSTHIQDARTKAPLDASAQNASEREAALGAFNTDIRRRLTPIAQNAVPPGCRATPEEQARAARVVRLISPQLGLLPSGDSGNSRVRRYLGRGLAAPGASFTAESGLISERAPAPPAQDAEAVTPP